MNHSAYEIALTLVYLAMWVCTLVWYQLRRPRADAGTAIISLYIVYGVFSYLTIRDEMFSMAFEPLKLFPYIFLYLMMLLALSPVIYNHLNPPKEIEDPNTRMLSIIGWVAFACAVLMIPKIMADAKDGGLVAIMSDATAGKEVYTEQIKGTIDSGSKIRNLPAVVYNTLADLPPFLMFYFLTKKRKSKLMLLALAATIAIGIYVPVSSGQRGGTINRLFTVLGAYLLFRQYLSSKINKFVTRAGIIMALAIAIPLTAITLSRFGKERAGVEGFVSWYVGQGSLYFNNYGLDNGGIRNGDRTMNLFKRIVDPNAPKNMFERRDRHRYLKIDDNFFSTFVGDFTIDFGPVVAVLIFLVFNGIAILLIRPRNGTIKVRQMLVLYLVVCINIQGGMTLYSFSDLGTMRIIVLVALCIYMKYHDVLLQKFPLVEKGTT